MNDMLTNYLDRKYSGVLRLSLKDRLSLYQLLEVFNVISGTYQSSLWLSVVENSEQPRTIPDRREPLPDEDLMIRHVEIGTPNVAEIAGLVQHLAPIVGMLTALLGFQVAIYKVDEARLKRDAAIRAKEKADIELNTAKLNNEQVHWQAVAEYWKAKEARLNARAAEERLLIDSRTAPDGITRRAKEDFGKGKITQIQLDQKLLYEELYRDNLKKYYPEVVDDVVLYILSEDFVGGISTNTTDG